MKITPISINQPSILNFKSKHNSYITKKVFESGKDKINDLKNIEKTAVIAAATAATVASGTSVSDIDEALKSKGIYCYKTNDNFINVSDTYNSGFYTIRAQFIPSEVAAKDYILQALNCRSTIAGGLGNYMDMVKDIKRQDIIQKGLKIHTYQLDNNVSKDDTKTAAYKLSKHLRYNIRPTDLFFVDDEAFYYESSDKTAYGLNLNVMRTNMKPVIRVCKFKTDEKGNAVGFNTKDWDSYMWQIREKDYSEQMSPSTKLSEIADSKNNKLFAEAFRFGNSTIKDNYNFKLGVPKVIDHLSKKLGIKFVDKDDLQFIRFYDSNNQIQSRIGYYDASSGRSLIYNKDGKYMYRMEYNKDSDGNITACSHF